MHETARRANVGWLAGALLLLASPGAAAPVIPSSPVPASQPASQPPSLVLPVPIEGGEHLARVRARLALLKSGGRSRVRITHWGDSHVASDAMTGTLRQRLQEAYGRGGPGFVLLGKPWRSYWHALVKTGASTGWLAERYWSRPGRKRPRARDDLWGLAGISTHSHGTATAWVESRGQHKLASLDLYLLRQPGGGRVEISTSGKRLRWVFTASSAKEADSVQVSLPPGARRLELRASLGEVRIFGADLASGERGVVYDALGINGARASTMLQSNRALWAQQLRSLAPDLLVVAYGSNEVDSEGLFRASFVTVFDELIKRLREMAPSADCLVVGPPDRGRYRRATGWEIPENLSFIVEEERRVALLRGCAFWDQRAAMGGPGSIERWLNADPPLARSDRVHFSGEGYRQLGQALYQALASVVSR